MFLLWVGAYVTDVCAAPAAQEAGPRPSFLARLAAPAAGTFAVVTAVMVSVPRLVETAHWTDVMNSHYERMGGWMRDNIPAGETVFHTSWSDSQYFIGLNPKNDYLVTLDPIFMYAWNPELYLAYRTISQGQADDPYTALQKVFGVRYGYASKTYVGSFVSQISGDPRFRIVVDEPLGVIFALQGPT
jgi:hypothetical protein